ncbi:hypothetical protein OR571_21670 [Psychrobacillus sp. NEAU-3TGS]|uniref:hypothetical protein n=1 Tax=Psychrobacillus sp. NEAU-3TGS TaxID=2995412 RepID=UPI002497E1AF|nr:hypothetical protein [Psychrobacillus sp. NEAU-3TGS]MDI2589639.1 hypothetical protein [Psychrobacillus sp. NEAU-3TGS]
MKIGLYLENSLFIEGILLDVKQDHIAVNIDGKVCYFTLEHIQAISNNAKDFHVLPKNAINYLNSSDLIGVLKQLKYNWVTINSLGNQELFGVLSNIFEDFIIVINHQELHYIAKSHIANIHKGIFEKEKNIARSTEKLNIEKVATNMEISKNTEKTTEISKENTIQEVVSSLIDEINELNDSKEEKEKNSAKEQNISVLKNKTDINLIKHLLELLNSIAQSLDMVNTKYEYNLLQMDQENLLSTNNEYEHHTQTNSEDAIQETTVQKIEHIHASLEEKIEVRTHLDEVVDSTTTEIKVETNIQTEPPITKNERRILLTPWSKMNYDQNTIAIAPNKTKKSSKNVKTPKENTQLLLEEEQNLLATNVAPKTEEVNVTMESQEPTELVATHTTVTVIDPRERKAMLEKQYYALMRHAEQSSTNLEHPLAINDSHHPSPLENKANNVLESDEFNKIRIQELKKGEKAMLEKQFNSLMRHAAKMYRQLRDY